MWLLLFLMAALRGPGSLHRAYFFRYVTFVVPMVPLNANGAWSKYERDTGESHVAADVEGCVGP